MTSAYTTGCLRRLRRATNGRPAITAALVVAIIVILVGTPHAQQAPAFVASASPAVAPDAAVAVPTDIDLLVGRSTVLNVGTPIARVSLTVPDIADAMVTAPSQLLVHGKQPGTISLFVWDRAGAIKTFEVNVRRDLTPLVAHMKQLFAGESITVMGSGKDVILSGTVGSKYVVEKAGEVAAGYVEKKENVVNLLKQQEGVASNQVMLRVRFAEVSRSALQELGASLFSDGNNNMFGRTTTQQFAAPFLSEPDAILGKSLVFSDYLNLFLFDAKNQLGAVVKALQSKGVFQSLAEPNLVAINGKEASFLAGGEFPIPVVQGGAQGNAVTIMFKEFGVRLNFTPTVLGGDLINLKIRPEVSALDFNNAIVIEGFRVPALTSRRADTEVELRDGQTFAIAGLMNNTATSSMRKVPGLGDIPILGMLFKSRAYQKDQTELVVMVTPHIIRRGQPGVSEGLPSLVEPYLGRPNKTLPNPDPYIGSPRYPVDKPSPSLAPAPAASQAPTTSAPAVQVQPAAVTPQQQAQAPAAAPAPSHDNHGAHAPAAKQPVPPALTRQQLKALEQAREEERKAAEKQAEEDAKAAERQQRAEAAAEKARLELEKRQAEARKAEERAEAKRRAEQAKKDAEQAKKDEETRKQAEKLEQERQKREAEVARRNAEAARRLSEEEQKRQKSLDEAAEKLKAAQEAYEAELARSATKTGGQ